MGSDWGYLPICCDCCCWLPKVGNPELVLVVELKGNEEVVWTGRLNVLVEGNWEIEPGGNCARAEAAKRLRSQNVNAILMLSVRTLE